jgi:hypothetical protein
MSRIHIRRELDMPQDSRVKARSRKEMKVKVSYLFVLCNWE